MWSVSIVVFFFSSRRRHTRCSRDWSSDVCSSDLGASGLAQGGADLDVHLDRQDLAGRQSLTRHQGAGAAPPEPENHTGSGRQPPPPPHVHPLTPRRGLAVLACVVFVLASDGAPAGHEIPFYPAFYPQEITLTVVAPAAAPRLLGKNALHAYV